MKKIQEYVKSLMKNFKNASCAIIAQNNGNAYPPFLFFHFKSSSDQWYKGNLILQFFYFQQECLHNMSINLFIH